MEVEQYFYAEEAGEEVNNGYHINVYLRNQYIEECKLTS